MKKQGLTVSLFICLGLTFTFCKKTEIPEHPTEASETTSAMESGLPGDYSSVNGYLYASFETTGTYSLGFVGAYAAFADPAKNLLPSYDHYEDQPLYGQPGNDAATQGNVSTGTLRFNNTPLSQSMSSGVMFYYTNTFISNNSLKSINRKWNSVGNQTFKPLDLVVDRNFPVIKDTIFKAAPVQTLSIANGFTLNVPASNYDSLTVYFESGSKNIKKTLVPGQAFIMSKTELTGFNTGAAQISFSAYNYSSQTIFGKRYVFEMARKSNGWLLNVKP